MLLLHARILFVSTATGLLGTTPHRYTALAGLGWPHSVVVVVVVVPPLIVRL